MKKQQRRNCWTCGCNTTTVTDPETGEVRPCTPWCQPYQDEWIDDSPTIDPEGIIAWSRAVGFNDENMPPRKSIPCPGWGKKRPS